MENKMIILLEDIKSLVKANIEGQKAFEERFERRLTNLENEMAETKKILAAMIKEISNVRTELKREIADVRTELKQDIADVRTELKQDIADVRTELKQDIASVRTELKQDIASVRTELADVRNDLKLLEGKVEQLKEKIITGTRKNEMWFDLIAREYGRLRLDLEVLKEEVSLLSQNA